MPAIRGGKILNPLSDLDDITIVEGRRFLTLPKYLPENKLLRGIEAGSPFAPACEWEQQSNLTGSMEANTFCGKV